MISKFYVFIMLSICNLILAIDQLRDCLIEPFPKFFGGSQESTIIEDFDVDPVSLNILIGGSTKDSGLVGFSTVVTPTFSNSYPLMALYDGTYGTLAWSKILNLP